VTLSLINKKESAILGIGTASLCNIHTVEVGVLHVYDLVDVVGDIQNFL
jgi:hypothetical protein